MAVAPSAALRPKRDLLALVRAIPRGRVATHDDLARHLKTMPPLILTMLARLSNSERDAAPWHRVVAKGGAIGRGAHRDAQLARLVREGVPVSPAGVVQDLVRLRIAASDLPPMTASDGPVALKSSLTDAAAAVAAIPPPAHSRGMRASPRGGLR